MSTGVNDDFMEAFMTHILEHVMVPKVQVERIVGPILGMFIPEILSALLGDEVSMICPEFPLCKVDRDGNRSNQSTNIDWLLYARRQDQLVFVELKTTDTTYDPVQHDIYQRVIAEIEGCSSSILTSDVERIMLRSEERGKYSEVLRRLGSDDHYRNCRKAKLVYIAPRTLARPSSKGTANEALWFSFEELPEAFNSRYPSEWKTIRRYLTQLDGFSRRWRNRNLSGTDENSSSTVA